MNVLRITVLLLMVCLFANGCSGDEMKKNTNVGNAASGSIVSESISGTTAVNYSPCFDIDKDYDYEIFEAPTEVGALHKENIVQEDLKSMKSFRKQRTDGYAYLVLADRLLTEIRSFTA